MRIGDFKRADYVLEDNREAEQGWVRFREIGTGLAMVKMVEAG